jgi:hypothetical protein
MEDFRALVDGPDPVNGRAWQQQDYKIFFKQQEYL